MSDEYLTSGAAAGRLRVSGEPGRCWCGAGPVPAVTIGCAHELRMSSRAHGCPTIDTSTSRF